MKTTASKRVLAAIMVVATALGTGAGAGPAIAQRSAEDDQKARELFRMGESHYIAGRYEKAVVLYEEAYRLSGRLELLLALANTCERMGDYGKAIDHLRQYLKSPKAKKVDAVRDRLQRLETSLRQREEERQRLIRLERAERERERARRRQRALAQAPRSSNAPDAAVSTSAQVEVRQGRSRLPFYLVLGGGATVGGAVVFGVLARRAHQDAEDRCADDLICPTSAQRALDREKRWAIAADVSAVVGVSSAAVGAFLWWRGRADSRESRRALRLQGTLLPGGGGIGVAGEF
jgi:tetratricopeptide (TPR) repeat protein